MAIRHTFGGSISDVISQWDIINPANERRWNSMPARQGSEPRKHSVKIVTFNGGYDRADGCIRNMKMPSVRKVVCCPKR